MEEPDELKDTKNVEVKQGFLKRIVAKCSSKDQPKKPVAFESNPNLRVKNTIKRIVNGRFVLTLMTFVTIFALIGVSTILDASLGASCSRSCHCNLNLNILQPLLTPFTLYIG